MSVLLIIWFAWLFTAAVVAVFAVLFFSEEVDWTFTLPTTRWFNAHKDLRLGLTHDKVYSQGAIYLERWMLWLPCLQWVEVGGTTLTWSKLAPASFTLRLHKFHQGDRADAPHDHPWWFVTFPLQTYIEAYNFTDDGKRGHRPVTRFRFHYRPAHHKHIVFKARLKPVWTIVLTGPWSRHWGFWPEPRKFVPWRQFK